MPPSSILSRPDGSPRRLAPAAAALLLPLAAGAAAAQTVSVSVRDVQSGAPVSAAMVRMENAAGVMVRAGFTQSDGTVRLRVPAGDYQVTVRRAGYQEGSAPLRVGTGEAALVVRLRARPFILDTVLVMVPGEGGERGRDAFLRRSRSQDGVFLDPAYLAQRYHLTYVGDMLNGVPDLMVLPTECPPTSSKMGCAGRLRPRVPVGTRGWGCYTPLIDGEPPRLSAFDAEYGHNQMDFWFRPRDFMGVEIYHVPSQIPRELRQYSNPRCGMIVYWTRRRW
ncbi:MAG TPA: carboxypeptidase-like regulatory domain-containing protein [Longimicrobium sp.]|nr:carboxypeptidase-like regulatory domain-containing protein [Longimicrobium sp.]